MEAIDVFVGYDNATRAITLDTSKGYEPEGSAAPTPTPMPSASADSSIVEYHTDLDANDGSKWRAVGTREGAHESLRQIPTSGYSSSVPDSSDELNFVETNILAIGEYDTSDKSNVYQKNWEDEYVYYPSQH